MNHQSPEYCAGRSVWEFLRDQNGPRSIRQIAFALHAYDHTTVSVAIHKMLCQHILLSVGTSAHLIVLSLPPPAYNPGAQSLPGGIKYSGNGHHYMGRESRRRRSEEVRARQPFRASEASASGGAATVPAEPARAARHKELA